MSNICGKDYNPDDLPYEDEEDNKKRIKQLEEEANKNADPIFQFSTNNYHYKEYPGTFSEEKAWDFLTSEDEREQLEAIRYALWFARNNDNDAKNFILMVINNPDLSNDYIVEKAKDAFALFIASFIRTEITKLYKKNNIHFSSASKEREAVVNAIGVCWEKITKSIHLYNPEKGMITTFLRTRIIDGFTEYESQRRGKPSKQVSIIDSKVAAARKSLEARGVTPTTRLIALELNEKNPSEAEKIGYQQIIASNDRITGEAGTFSYDDSSDDAFYFREKQAQKIFLTPDEYLAKKQIVEDIIKAIHNLDPIEQKIFLMSNGFEIENDLLYESTPYSEAEIAEMLNISTNDVFKGLQKARDIIKNSLSNKKEDADSEDLIYMDSLEDDNIEDFLSSIVKIDDDNFKESDY